MTLSGDLNRCVRCGNLRPLYCVHCDAETCAELERLRDDNASLRQALSDTGPLIEGRDAEIERLRATVARVGALEPFVFKDRPRMPAVVSYHALCTALGVPLALDGDASAGEDSRDEGQS